MDKIIERKAFDSIYGSACTWRISESESPDFICYAGEIAVLGAEITELFPNESAARLKKIPGYLSQLVESKHYRHKKDKYLLKVETLTFQGSDGEKQEFPGVIQQLPKFEERTKILLQTISEKEKKIEQYLLKAKMIDLILDDCSSLFNNEDYILFYFTLTSIIDRLSIVNSPFREIFLITDHQYQKRIKIPLKLNLIAEDFELFTRALTGSPKFNDAKWRNNYFLWLGKCLRDFGYKKIGIVKKTNGAAITLGCWEIGMWDNNKKIEGYVTRPDQMPPSELISDELDSFIEWHDKNVSEFLEARKKNRCCFPLFFDTNLAFP